ncbi:MAG TPA: TlpA disulfide reductase family protein [Dehalococcoidia bacterium]|nr:TlpA disulfide reductase family protein [Dehalococcoidia bacterium]
MDLRCFLCHGRPFSHWGLALIIGAGPTALNRSVIILETGSLALPFALLGIDGRERFFPKDAAGQPAVLVFFKTTCGTCDLAFPYINRLPAAYQSGWRLFAVAQDSPDEARRYAQRHGMTYPVLIDAPAYAASKLYDPPATPTLFLVDGDGRIGYSTHGFSKDDLNELSRRLAGWLGEEPAVIAPADDGKPAFKPG